MLRNVWAVSLDPEPDKETLSWATKRIGVVLEATDLHAEGFGTPWRHRRSVGSRLTPDTNVGSGYNWQLAHWPCLVFPCATTAVVMPVEAHRRSAA